LKRHKLRYKALESVYYYCRDSFPNLLVNEVSYTKGGK